MIKKIFPVNDYHRITVTVPECGNGYMLNDEYLGYKVDGEWYATYSDWYSNYAEAVADAQDEAWNYEILACLDFDADD